MVVTFSPDLFVGTVVAPLHPFSALKVLQVHRLFLVLLQTDHRLHFLDAFRQVGVGVLQVKGLHGGGSGCLSRSILFAAAPVKGGPEERLVEVGFVGRTVMRGGLRVQFFLGCVVAHVAVLSLFSGRVGVLDFEEVEEMLGVGLAF